MFDATDAITRYLAPGERVVWEGRGRGRSMLSSSSAAVFTTDRMDNTADTDFS
ncbi:MAG TPA: hypothetical protein VJG32_03895 [Anaerolineae bacterium]|nr:hypothetical protein [Anaerolineae bacterium]